MHIYLKICSCIAVCYALHNFNNTLFISLKKKALGFDNGAAKNKNFLVSIKVTQLTIIISCSRLIAYVVQLLIVQSWQFLVLSWLLPIGRELWPKPLITNVANHMFSFWSAADRLPSSTRLYQDLVILHAFCNHRFYLIEFHPNLLTCWTWWWESTAGGPWETRGAWAGWGEAWRTGRSGESGRTRRRKTGGSRWRETWGPVAKLLHL